MQIWYVDVFFLTTYNRINEIFSYDVNSIGFHPQMIREFALVLSLVYIVSSSDFRWRNAIEFWSNVVCSMEDIKTVNFHNVLESSGSSIFLERYFQIFVYDIAHKCQTTIVSRIYTLRDSENLASFVNDNDAAHAAVKRPSIWKITSNDALSSRVILSSATGKIRIRSDKKTFSRNTWNVHVILARDICSLDQISKDGTIFEWNSHDRFIVLIARISGEDGPSNESNSRISDILKILWSERKVQKVFVSEMILANDTVQINQIVRTYNPFAKVNNSGS